MEKDLETLHEGSCHDIQVVDNEINERWKVRLTRNATAFSGSNRLTMSIGCYGHATLGYPALPATSHLDKTLTKRLESMGLRPNSLLP